MTADTNQTLKHALPDLLTIQQTAEALQVSTKSVRRWIEVGDLIAHRLGRQWRVSEPDLQNFIRARRNS